MTAGVKTLKQSGRICSSLAAASGRLPVSRLHTKVRAVRTHSEVVESLNASVNSLSAPQQHNGRQGIAAASRPAFPPVISGTARTADDIASELITKLEQYPQALVCNVEPEMYAALRKLVPDVKYQARAKMLIVKPEASPVPKMPRLPGSVCVLSAGPADQVAADQVKVAAEHLGCYVMSKTNISTRDMPHLMEQVQALQAADVVVVIAGVDSCLAGVVAGLVDAQVIAVPTSNGAANGLQGLGNLVAAVSSCAPGVSVVDIDGAVSAAVVAARVLRTTAARVEKLTAAAAAAPPAAAAAAPVAATFSGVANNVVPRFDGLVLNSAQVNGMTAGAL